MFHLGRVVPHQHTLILSLKRMRGMRTLHSRLLQKFVTYDRKKFYNIGSGPLYVFLSTHYTHSNGRGEERGRGETLDQMKVNVQNNIFSSICLFRVAGFRGSHIM